MKFKKKLIEMYACSEAVKWVGDKSLLESWNTCQRGDWMLWYVSKNKTALGLEDMRLIGKAKAKCASLVRHLMKDGRSLKALDVAIRFGDGEATREELGKAVAAAVAAVAAVAVAAVDVDVDDVAADVAAYAADAAAAAVVVAVDVDVAAAVADVAYAAGVARSKTLSQCADICRDLFKNIPAHERK